MADADILFELEGVFRMCKCASICPKCAAARMAYCRMKELLKELAYGPYSHCTKRQQESCSIMKAQDELDMVRKAIVRSGLDTTMCSYCGELLYTLPDGGNLCAVCAKENT